MPSIAEIPPLPVAVAASVIIPGSAPKEPSATSVSEEPISVAVFPTLLLISLADAASLAMRPGPATRIPAVYQPWKVCVDSVMLGTVVSVHRLFPDRICRKLLADVDDMRGGLARCNNKFVATDTPDLGPIAIKSWEWPART